MYACSAHKACWLAVVVSAFGVCQVEKTIAQEVIRVYGSEGPAPAMHEAAATFGNAHGVQVEVVSGPAETWLAKAKSDADVIFSSAEFMMSDFVRNGELKIDKASVTPLYLRPSAILVRPGNPKGIRDFPHLLRPGIRVMVVTGSGQTGLWEDMAGKQGDVRAIRALRDNIVVFAPNSETAVKTWRERDDIDAWITWNIWYTPLHDHADLVPVGPDYRVYRQCNAALTEHGKSKPLAARLIRFLASPEGAKIFESWGWETSPSDASRLRIESNIAIVCRVDEDEWKEGVGAGLLSIRRLIEHYESIGVPASELHISAVVHGRAGYWLLKDGPYQAVKKDSSENPNKALIRELDDLGVSIELCAETMAEHGWTKEDVLPEVTVVVGACPRVVDLQLQGYAYWRF
jgi:accessory colonization factor AcfC